MTVNVHQAKTQLSRLILRAERGEDVVIARAGKPAVRLVVATMQSPRTRKLGRLAGTVHFPADFDSRWREEDQAIAEQMSPAARTRRRK